MNREGWFGLTVTWAGTPHRKGARRHIWWTTVHSKCGQELVVETTDLSIPVCGGCRIMMERLHREQQPRNVL